MNTAAALPPVSAELWVFLLLCFLTMFRKELSANDNLRDHEDEDEVEDEDEPDDVVSAGLSLS